MREGDSTRACDAHLYSSINSPTSGVVRVELPQNFVEKKYERKWQELL